jgi:hypothetical protein
LTETHSSVPLKSAESFANTVDSNPVEERIEKKNPMLDIKKKIYLLFIISTWVSPVSVSVLQEEVYRRKCL